MSSTASTATVWKPTILGIGDSLMWARNDYKHHPGSVQPGSVADGLSKISCFYNAGANGYNTDMMVHELPKILVACTESNFDPNAAVIWLGANDSVLKGPDTQHVPLDRFKSNLTDMAQTFHEAYPSAELIFINNPPADAKRWQKLLDAWQGKETENPILDRTGAQTKAYAKATLEVATELQERFGNGTVHMVDAYSLISKAAGGTGPSQLESDGLHLNEKGYQPITDEVTRIVGSLNTKQVPRSLLTDDPGWSIPTYRPPGWREVKETLASEASRDSDTTVGK